MSAAVNSESGAVHGTGAGPLWFCVRTRNKQESIAASHLRQEVDIDVFLPRIRYKRVVRSRPVWRTEALFQNYLFARFDFKMHSRRVQHARGVRGVVHFGARWPVIPAEVIDELRRDLGPDELRVFSEEPEIGEAVVVAAGPLSGLPAVVIRQLRGPQRVAVLLEFLGQQTVVELGCNDLVTQHLRWHPACAEAA